MFLITSKLFRVSFRTSMEKIKKNQKIKKIRGKKELTVMKINTVNEYTAQISTKQELKLSKNKKKNRRDF